MFKLNSKNETLNILTSYFKQFNTTELCYYLENYKGDTIPKFLESNIYDPNDIELLNLLIEHLKIVINKVFYITTPYNMKRFPIKLSFKTNSIYWDELFVIEDTIFISYPYLKKIFEKIEYNEYKSVENIYINGDKIYDLELLKKLGESMYYIIQFLNFDYWQEFICEKYQCSFVDKSLIKFTNKYNILKEPNTSFINDKITIYWLYSGEIYTIINSIYSEDSFSPYWEKKIIKLKYSNGEYTEISDDKKEEDSTDTNTNTNTKNNNKNMFKFNFCSNPFVKKAKQMTDCTIHNK
jgi:hypothetical protein